MIDMEKLTPVYDATDGAYYLNGNRCTQSVCVSRLAKVIGDDEAMKLVADAKAKAVEELKEHMDLPEKQYSTTSEAVEDWFQDNNITVNAAGVMDSDLEINDFIHYMEEYNTKMEAIPKDLRKGRTLRNSSFKPAYAQHVSKLGRQALEMVRSDVRHHPDIKRAWRVEFERFMNIISKPDDPIRELHEAVIKHQLWQVKRKLFNLPVEMHMLLFFFGRQGSGKTTLIRRLGAPFADLYIEPSGEVIKDKFGGRLTHTHYIANVEEFTGADNVQIEALKAFISLADRTEREMFSTSAKRYKQNLTLFSTSNRKLKRVVRDFSGMRRFWEIDLNPMGKKLDFDLVNSIDYYLLWKGIDENQKISPLFDNPDTLDKMAPIQDSWRARNTAEAFLERGRYLPLKGVTKQYKVRDLWEEYRQACIEDGEMKKLSITRFTGLLLDIESIEIENDEEGLPYYVTLNVVEDDDEDEGLLD